MHAIVGPVREVSVKHCSSLGAADGKAKHFDVGLAAASDPSLEQPRHHRIRFDGEHPSLLTDALAEEKAQVPDVRTYVDHRASFHEMGSHLTKLGTLEETFERLVEEDVYALAPIGPKALVRKRAL
jgi:hypothetical protein